MLVVVARLLDYPSQFSKEDKKEIVDLVDEIIVSEQIKETIKNRYQPLMTLNSREIQELYVQTFDLKTSSNLYLTAYELGDSNMRGAALIRLQKLVNEAGFERDNRDLADYIPMLLEFLAVAPEAEVFERLHQRVGVAIHYMKERMDESNPYTQIVALLTEYVFAKPTEEQLKQLEDGREEADLEELPYPIMYQ